MYKLIIVFAAALPGVSFRIHQRGSADEIASITLQALPLPPMIKSRFTSKLCNKTYDGDRIEYNNKTKRHGTGSCTFDKKGSKYTGAWVNDTATGKGKVDFYTGETYDGEIKKGAFQGHGTYQWATGDIYEGKWKRGKRTKGTTRFANGNVYSGEYKNDRPHGRGRFDFAEGSSHEGRYVNGNVQGRGMYIFPNGNIYKGQFEGGQMTGMGTMFFPVSGDEITSRYENGHAVGKGIIIRGTTGKRYGACNGHPVTPQEANKCVASSPKQSKKKGSKKKGSKKKSADRRRWKKWFRFGRRNRSGKKTSKTRSSRKQSGKKQSGTKRQ